VNSLAPKTLFFKDFSPEPAVGGRVAASGGWRSEGNWGLTFSAP
jgi:hypothetical protein